MKTRLLKIFICLVFTAGLAIFLYPYATRWIYEYDASKVVDNFMEQFPRNEHMGNADNNVATDEATTAVDVADDTTKDATEDTTTNVIEGTTTNVTDDTTNKDTQDNEGNTTENLTDDENVPTELTKLNKLFNELQTYNQKIYDEKQAGLRDPFSTQGTKFDLTNYGFDENVIGILWIPRMELELPIYMGATYEHLKKGIGLLDNTSVPLGGTNTNSILAGHRGWKGIPMFRNIQSIQLGDKIQITTPWDTLVYRVTELKIVPRDESSVLYIQDGREIITLLTCHPYTRNEQRYIVIAERSDEPPDTKENDVKEAEKTDNSEPQQVVVVTDEGECIIENISPDEIAPVFNEGAGEDIGSYSSTQIWLETWLPIIGISIVLITIIITCLVIKIKLRNKDKYKDENEE